MKSTPTRKTDPLPAPARRAPWKAGARRLLLALAIGGLLLAGAQDGPATTPPATAPDGAPADEPAASPDAAPGDAPADAPADDVERRVITIDSSGGTQSGNLLFGPIRYEHPEPDGIVATVSNLTIYSGRASLRAPEGERIAAARGRREATFEGGVRVERGRLTATGPGLAYSEATGLGTLQEGASVVIAPSEEGEDETRVEADAVEFDVDTDRSISRGDVVLTSGSQRAEAQAMEFAEEQDLGCLTSEGAQVRVVRTADDGSETVITADRICVLTEEERLLARGGVTIVDGAVTTTGDEAFYDDEASRALVFGSPAESVNADEGSTTRGAALEQRTDLDAVRIYSGEVDFDEAAFAFREAE